MLARLAPREVLVSEAHEDELRDLVARGGRGGDAARAGELRFDSAARRGSPRVYRVAALDGFAAFDRAEVAALGAIVDYLDLTQRGRLPLLRPPVARGRRRADADRRARPGATSS